ncbi:Ig-like domain-containing protein, partial [Limnohabitans radicicola]
EVFVISDKDADTRTALLQASASVSNATYPNPWDRWGVYNWESTASVGAERSIFGSVMPWNNGSSVRTAISENEVRLAPTLINYALAQDQNIVVNGKFEDSLLSSNNPINPAYSTGYEGAGMIIGGYGHDPLIGGISEVIYFNRALSTTERQAVTLYLMEKWGVGTLGAVVAADTLTNMSNVGNAAALVDQRSTGTSAQESFVVAGADLVRAGAGNDAITANDANFRLIDGGAGNDTLHVNFSSGQARFVNLSAHVSNYLNNAEGLHKLERIEKIDLRGQAISYLQLSEADVLQMSDNDSLIVRGDANSRISFADSGWTLGAINIQGWDGGTYRNWTKGAASVLVDTSIESSNITASTASLPSVRSISINDDTGISATDRVTSDAALVYSFELSQALAGAQQLQVEIDGSPVNAQITQVGNSANYTLDMTGYPLSIGKHVVVARVVDGGSVGSYLFSEINVVGSDVPTSPTNMDLISDRLTNGAAAETAFSDNTTIGTQNLIFEVQVSGQYQDARVEFYRQASSDTSLNPIPQNRVAVWHNSYAKESTDFVLAANGKARAVLDLPVGEHKVYAVLIDQFGNRSNPSAALTVSVLADTSLSVVDYSAQNNSVSTHISGTANKGSLTLVWSDTNSDGLYDQTSETLIGWASASVVDGTWTVSTGDHGTVYSNVRAMSMPEIDRTFVTNRFIGTGAVTAPITLTVDKAGPLVSVPQADVVFSAPNGFIAGETVSVTVTFNEAVKGVVGSSGLYLNFDGVNRLAALSSTNTANKTATFSYVLQPTDVDSDGIEIAANPWVNITDLVGNAAVSFTRADDPSTAIDTVLPTLQSVAAAAGGNTITLQFSEPIDTSNTALTGLANS